MAGVVNVSSSVLGLILKVAPTFCSWLAPAGGGDAGGGVVVISVKGARKPPVATPDEAVCPQPPRKPIKAAELITTAGRDKWGRVTLPTPVFAATF